MAAILNENCGVKCSMKDFGFAKSEIIIFKEMHLRVVEDDWDHSQTLVYIHDVSTATAIHSGYSFLSRYYDVTGL